MSEFEIWVYRGAASALILLLIYGIKKLVQKIDELIKAIQNLAQNDVKQAQQIEFINDRLRTNETRLNEHSTRIRSLETQNRKANNG